jgi:hypothetical protein
MQRMLSDRKFVRNAIEANGTDAADAGRKAAMRLHHRDSFSFDAPH